MEKNNPEEIKASIKQGVMQKIREKKIEMRSPLVFMAEKLGLESAAATGIIFGALLISLISYLLEKTGLIKFLSLGIPGMKVFLMAFPYDYLILFILAIILAVYFANKSQIFCGNCEKTSLFAAGFSLLSAFLGIFFFTSGSTIFFKDLRISKLPEDSAIRGKIINFSENSAIVEDQEGNRTTIILSPKEKVDEWENRSEGKYIWAVGKIDKKNKGLFHAEKVHCCEDE